MQITEIISTTSAVSCFRKH